VIIITCLLPLDTLAPTNLSSLDNLIASKDVEYLLTSKLDTATLLPLPCFVTSVINAFKLKLFTEIASTTCSSGLIAAKSFMCLPISLNFDSSIVCTGKKIYLPSEVNTSNLSAVFILCK